MGAKEKALVLHDKGFNCAQSVLAALGEYTGLDEKTALAVTGGKWATEKCGKGCVCTYADGSLYVRNAQGEAFLVSANGTNFALNGKMKLPGGSSYKGVTAPVVANGKLYIRSDSMLCCYDISVNSEAGPQSGAAATGIGNGE